MGKNQHSKDRMYLTRTEHLSGEHRGSGKQATIHLPYRSLPFDCCAISFRPFETPLCTADGIIFELMNIVPYLKTYRRHPVTGAALAASDLIKLNFHRNSEKQYACPVLYKPFTQHTHIVAIKTTGNVYCYDAVKQMNLKPGHLRDLLDETPFTREDIIHIQDPSDGSRREMEKFSHVVESLQVETKQESGVRHNDATTRIMQQVKATSKAAGGSAAAAASAASSAAATQAKPASSAAGGSGTAPAAARGGVPAARWMQTTGAASASFTSTSVPVQTVNEIAPLSDAEATRQRYAFVRARKEKGYVQIQTSHGAINLELHVDVAPMTCENFLLLLERGYYDRTPVHRLIKNFMVQMGDPTGTGGGGESAWGKPFKDEISNKLRHEGRGVLSMANSGPHTNGSQFFITLKSASHLDGKHAVFGRVVGGMDVLARLEALPTDKDDRPKQPVTLNGGSVFVNPFADIEAKMAAAQAKLDDPTGADAEAKAKAEAEDREAWFNNATLNKPVAHRAGIGKFIAPHHLKQGEPGGASAAGSAAATSSALKSIAAADMSEAAPPEPPKKRARATGGFGSFDSW